MKEKMTAAQFRKKFCPGAAMKESKPSTPARVANTGTGRRLVPVEITVNGHKEIHYVFEGSELEAFWRGRAAEKQTTWTN